MGQKASFFWGFLAWAVIISNTAVLKHKKSWAIVCSKGWCVNADKCEPITGGFFMLRAALLFFVLALVAILFGATGFAGVSMEIGRTLLVVFLILAVISYVASLIGGRSPRQLP